MYKESRQHPPLGHNMPPVTGRISWARQLYKHLEDPMNILKQRPGLLNTPQGLAVVRKYNRVALGLTEYELLLYRAWTEHVTTANRSLQVRITICLYCSKILRLV